MTGGLEKRLWDIGDIVKLVEEWEAQDAAVAPEKRPKRFDPIDIIICGSIGVWGALSGLSKPLTMLIGLSALLASIGLRHLWQVWRNKGAKPPQP